MLEANRPVHSKNTDVDPFVLLRLRQLTYLKLRAMGLTPTSKAKADLIVGVLAARDEEIFVYSSGPYVYDSLYGPRWSTQVTRVEEGVVVIDLIDREKKGVVWRGTGVRVIGRQFEEQELREIVDAILMKYPPATEGD
jgi:hypothetical protein